MAETLELPDIQGLIIRGYGDLASASYLLLSIEHAEAARHWLATLAAMITPGHVRPQELALNVALSASGLEKLGLAAPTLAQFSYEFRSGMASDHRQRILGDDGQAAPEHWDWGGPSTPTVDVLLLLFARDDTRLEQLYRTQSAEFAAAGLREIRRLDTSDLGPAEHFGFHDGVSQPYIEGLGKDGPPEQTVRAGEFMLGYQNEYGLYTDRPLLDANADPQRILPRDTQGKADLGRNGTYLVIRQLAQDVAGFWRWIDAVASAHGESNEATRLRLAASMVGRWPSGASLLLSPEKDDPALADSNDFLYHEHDAAGIACPLGSHVRRVNPRDTLDPQPGSDESIAINKRHRLLRRGRKYGPALSAADALAHGDDGIERGLHFLCLNGNIARQFEFVQHTWVNNPKFHELYEDADPLLAGSKRSFTIQAQPFRKRYGDLPRFVTPRGGGYFFLPGIRALRFLAAGAWLQALR